VRDVSQPLKAPPLTSHAVFVGVRTEAAILSELVRRGHCVLVPFGTNQRYDLVIELDGKFVRAQCKTGRLRNGVIVFSTRSTRANMRLVISRDYVGEADIFLVHCPDAGGVYAIPVKEAPKGEMYLRLLPTENGQHQRVRWAKEYELPG
jgi:hypothetical protein